MHLVSVKGEHTDMINCPEIPLSGLQSLREAHTRGVPRDNNKIPDGGKHSDLELPGQGDAYC